MNTKKILIVEDEVIVARDIQACLDELGYEVVGFAIRGEEVIDLVDQMHPDLVLMDIQLAGVMDGIAVAQTIRTHFALPVVFLTAFAADEILARAKLSEPFGYILKPFSERELRVVLEMAFYKHAAETRLIESAMHTRAILNNIVDGVITINSQGFIESFNLAASRIFGYTHAEVQGRNVAMLMPEPQRSHHDTYLENYHLTGVSRVIGKASEVMGQRKDGGLFPLSLSVSKISHAGQSTFIGITRDLSQQYSNKEEIHRLAFYDQLTELPNRHLLMEYVQQAMLHSAHSGHHGALLLLDLDYFKQLNDTRGLEVGDVLLRQVAARLKTLVRQVDRVARLGGDEFVVLLAALSSQAHEAATQAEASAKEIIHALSQPYILCDQVCNSTPSLGIVLFQGAEHSLDQLLKKADIAMYQAKDAGRNTLRFFDAAMQASVVAHVERIADLHRGVAEQEFVLHYQIQVNSLGVPIGAEALIRWQHPLNGLVFPACFIALTEETKLILPLGQWVLETACAQLVMWAAQPDTEPWIMAVNVSALQFSQADFVDHVMGALQRTGANPARLKLELTESMLIGDVPDIIMKMHALKALGVSFSLDDFGTGYSSLSYLKLLPLNQLKIDQSFVRNLLSDSNDAVIARAIVALGHSFGLQVIAEGVETVEQRDLLLEIECDAFQGYHFGRPMAADQLPFSRLR